MKMYLVVTTCPDEEPVYSLYKTYAVAQEDFWSRIGSYVYNFLCLCTKDKDLGKVLIEKATKYFDKCYVDENFISFDEIEIYIKEIEVKD